MARAQPSHRVSQSQTLLSACYIPPAPSSGEGDSALRVGVSAVAVGNSTLKEKNLSFDPRIFNGDY